MQGEYVVLLMIGMYGCIGYGGAHYSFSHCTIYTLMLIFELIVLSFVHGSTHSVYRIHHVREEEGSTSCRVEAASIQ